MKNPLRSARLWHLVSMPGRFPALLLGLALLLSPERLPAHGDLHERIARLSDRIALNPADATLHVQRASLRVQHEEWSAALDDCRTAARLGSAAPSLPLLEARCLAALHRPEEAAALYRRVLEAHPESAEARSGLAALLSQQGRTQDAARLLDNGLSHATDPQQWLDAAQAWQAAGDPVRALNTITRGITALGPLVSLEEPALDLEITLGRTEDALARLTRLETKSPRRELWLVRRAEVLFHAQRFPEAETARRNALAAIEQLPPRLRHTRAMQALVPRLNRLAPPVTAQSP